MNTSTQNDVVTPRRVPWLTPQVRAWAYRVILATLPLLSAYGLLAESQQALWAALAEAVLGMGMAVAHTPRTVPAPAGPPLGGGDTSPLGG